jgi:hypothetical protein
LEARVPDVAGLQPVAKIDTNRSGRLALDHCVQDADVMVGMTEIGEQHDRTHGVTLAHLLPLLEAMGGL